MRSINFILVLTLVSAFQVAGEITKLVNKFTPDKAGFRQEYLEVLLLRKDLLENDGAIFVENNGTVYLLATGSTSAREKSTPAERGLEKLRRDKVAGQKAVKNPAFSASHGAMCLNGGPNPFWCLGVGCPKGANPSHAKNCGLLEESSGNL